MQPGVRSEAAHDADDDTLDRDVVLVDVHGRHRLVRRLQTNASIALAVELLHRRRIAVEHGDHHLAVVGPLAFVHDDEVAVPDVLLDHRIPANPQHVVIAAALHERIGDGDGLLVGDGFQGVLDQPPASATTTTEAPSTTTTSTVVPGSTSSSTSTSTTLGAVPETPQDVHC